MVLNPRSLALILRMAGMLAIVTVTASFGYVKTSLAAQTIPVATSIYELIADPDRPFVYASDSKHNQILVVSTTSRKVINRISVGVKPTDMSLNLDATLLYVANTGAGSVSVINLNTQLVMDTISLAFSPSSVVAGRANRIYAGGCTADVAVRNEIAIIDTASHAEVGRFAGSVIHESTSDGRAAFVTEGCGFSFPNVRKWDISTDSPTVVIEDNLWGGGCNWDAIPQLVLSPDDSSIFLAAGTTGCSVNNNGVLPVLNSDTFVKLGELNLEYQPVAVAINASGTTAFATHNGTLINPGPGTRHDRLRKDIHTYSAQMFTEGAHLTTTDFAASKGLAVDEASSQVFAVVGSTGMQNIDIVCTDVNCSEFLNSVYVSSIEENRLNLQLFTGDQASAFNLYSVCIATDDVPTAADIKAGRKNGVDLAESTDALAGATGNSHQLVCDGLTPNTEYTVYSVIETPTDVFSDVFSDGPTSTLAKRDTSTNFTIPLNTSVSDILYDPSRELIYVADSDNNLIRVIDRLSRQIETEILIPGKPGDIDLSKNNQFLYIAAGNSIVTINLNTRMVVDTMTLSFFPASISAGREGRIYASQCQVGSPDTNLIAILDTDNKLEIDTFPGATVHTTDSTGGSLYTTTGCGSSAPDLQKWDVSTDTPSLLLTSDIWGGGCGWGNPPQAVLSQDDANLYLVSGRASCSVNNDGKIPSISTSNFVKSGEIELDWGPLTVNISQDQSTVVAAHYDTVTNATPRERHDRFRPDLHVFNGSLIEDRHLDTSALASESGLIIAHDGSEVFAVVGLPGEQNLDVRCLTDTCTPITNTVYPVDSTATELVFDLVVNIDGITSFDAYAVCVADSNVPTEADIKAGRKNATENAEAAASMVNLTGNTVRLSCSGLNSLTDYTIYAVIETDSLSPVFMSRPQKTQILRDVTSSKTILLESSIYSLLADPNRPYVYASDSDTNQVHIINSASGNIITSVFAGSRPTAMSFSQDGKQLYVAVSGGSTVAVIDLDSQTALSPINLTFSPSSLAAGRPGRLYVGGCMEDGTVRNEIVIIDTVSGDEVGRFTGAIPHTTDASGNNIYVTERCGNSYPRFSKWDVSSDTPTQVVSEHLWGGGCGWQSIPQAILSPDENSVYMVSGRSSCSANYNGKVPYFDTTTFAKSGELDLEYTAVAGAISLNSDAAAFSHYDQLVNATPAARHDRLRKDVHVFDGLTLKETPHIATSDFVSTYGLAITPSATQLFAIVGSNGSQNIDIRCLVEQCTNTVEQISQLGESETTVDFEVSVIGGDTPYDLYAVCTQATDVPTAEDIKAGRINTVSAAEGTASALNVSSQQQNLSCGSLSSNSEFTIHAVVEIPGVGFTSVLSKAHFSTNDGDTIPAEQDNCPNIPNQAQTDTDLDGAGDACDLDDDNDGVDDTNDLATLNPMVCRDLDADMCDDCSIGVDGLGPLSDFDTQNDGNDNDADGLCDIGDNNDDGDTIEDENDNCPLVDNESQENLDEDEFGDACDPDKDGDGVIDTEDSDDLDPLVCADTDLDQCDDCSSSSFNTNNDGDDNDGDGFCDIGDTDDDNDSVPDDIDNCPFNANSDQSNLDGDTFGDLCDDDVDGDTVLGTQDSNDFDPKQCSDSDNDLCDDCSSGIFNPSQDGADNDADGLCDIGDTNDDNDLFVDESDNCPLIANDDQANLDKDAFGDACDSDVDGDNVNSDQDSNDFDPLVCTDSDNDLCDDCSSGAFAPLDDGIDNENDGLCDLGDPNDDTDSIPDDLDNCPFIANESQSDLDSDDEGDACDSDADGDTVLSNIDSDDLNPYLCLDSDNDQCDDCSSGTFATENDGLDTDSDGQCDLGDADDDDDLVPDELDNCPTDFNPDQIETPCDDGICMPIRSKGGDVSLICL
jgi:YVTN family beta-propeller protein